MSKLTCKKNKQIIFGTIIVSSFFIASQSFAGCYFVACPNNAPPPPKTNNQYYAPVQNIEINDDDYNQGFQDGLRAAKPKVVYVKSKNNKKTYKTVSKKPVITKTSVKSQKVKKTYVSNSYTGKSTTSKKTKTYSTKAHSYAYKPVQTHNYLPIKDRASTYQAGQYGPSIAVASLMGRGEQWVSSKTQIIRYNRPHNIQIVNGKACGWSNPISSYSNGANNAWVCQCEQGWLKAR